MIAGSGRWGRRNGRADLPGDAQSTSCWHLESGSRFSLGFKRLGVFENNFALLSYKFCGNSSRKLQEINEASKHPYLTNSGKSSKV